MRFIQNFIAIGNSFLAKNELPADVGRSAKLFIAILTRGKHSLTKFPHLRLGSINPLTGGP